MLLRAVVLEAQPLVILARQPDGAIIHLPAIQREPPVFAQAKVV